MVARALHSLENGDAFRVAQELEGDDGVVYLRLEDGRGWACDSRSDQKSKVCVRDEASRYRAGGIELPPFPGGKAAAEAKAEDAGRTSKAAFTEAELEDVVLAVGRLREASSDSRGKLAEQLSPDMLVLVTDHLWAEQPRASLRDLAIGH